MRKIKSIISALAAILTLSLASALTSCDKGVNVTGIQIQPELVTLGVGETQGVIVTVTPDDADDQTFTLESSNVKVATVNNCLITAVAPGVAEIVATSADGGLKSVCKVTVIKRAEDITLSQTELKVTIGKTAVISVEFTPSDATNQEVTWVSSKPEVAAVSDGVVTGVAAGEALITATSVDGGFSAACKVVVEPEFDGVVATKAGGYYCGDQYGNGYDEDFVYLLSGDVKEGGCSLAGNGTALWLDLNLPKTGATTLPAHHYTPVLTDGQDMNYTWQPGQDLGSWGIIGTFIYSYNEGDGEPQYIMAEKGTVDITVKGSEYTIEAVLTAGGKEYNFRYTGPVILKDVKDAGDPPVADRKEVDLGDELTQGVFEYDGDIYSTGGVSHNWLVYLADKRVDFTKKNLTGPGKIMMLELNTDPAAGNVLPAGTYTVISPENITSAAALTPFTAVPGIMNSENKSVYGTWYLATEETEGAFQPLCGPQKGTITVKKSGSTYSIDFDVTDDDFNISVKGSYSGVPSVFDATASTSTSLAAGSSAAKRASTRFMNVRKNAKRQSFRK